jgi:glyoxylase-like metal-dependent hydrolase (beta-lactamase superfamily II)
MRIHHLNCISSCPLGGTLMDARSPGVLQRGQLCCHCLLLETSQGLVLIDTGFGLRDVANPASRLSTFFLSLLSPDFREEMTAARQIEQLGFHVGDVRHIVLTHLDFDHAGGLDDFPNATVHMMKHESDYAFLQKTWLDRQRFRPQQWSSIDRWKAYREDAGERWFGFECVRQLDGLPPEILLVPLIGHTWGHAGIAIDTADGWLLQAGDAYFFHHEMDAVRPYCTPGLSFYQTMMEKDRQARLSNQERLRQLRITHGAQVEVFCSHDPDEFERMAGHALNTPAGEVTAAAPHVHHHDAPPQTLTPP